MEKLDRALELVIDTIKESSEYKKCLELKELMNNNNYLKELIQEIKDLQKRYVRNSYDLSTGERLNKKIKELEEIPLYRVYLNNLSVVNNYIDYVRDSMNEYFDNLLNEKY